MSKIKRKIGGGFGSEGLSGAETETEGQNRGARSWFAEEMPDRARRPSPMRMPELDVRELSDEMLKFMLQLMAPEKYGSSATQVRKIRDQKPEVRDQGECGGRCASATVAGADLSRSQRDTIENTLMPESGCGFISYDADGEGIMRLECPEFSRRRGPVNLISLRALRSFAAKTSELEPMNLPQRNAESTKINNAAVSGQQGDAAGNTELAESPCGFISYDADVECLMRQKCPELSRRGSKAPLGARFHAYAFRYANGVPLTEGADAQG